MANLQEQTRYEKGLTKLVEISGQAGQDVVAPLGDLGRYIVEFGYGDIFSRPGLSVREREMATVALLTAMGGREPQLRVHILAALKAGITAEEVKEVIIQTVPYAGFPTAINATNLLNQILVTEMAGSSRPGDLLP